MSSIVEVSDYDFKFITDKTVKLEESFVNLYVDGCIKSDRTISSTRIMRRIIDAKYKKSDLNKVMNEQYQHITATS